MRVPLFRVAVAALGAAAAYAQSALPLILTADPGQTGGPRRYIARSPRMRARFGEREMVLETRRGALRLEFPGATGPGRIEPAGQAPGAANFLIGGEESWQLGVPLLAGVRYRELFGGIDLVYSPSGAGLKMEFVVPPGEHPGRIRVRYAGARLTLESDGSLSIRAGNAALRASAPAIYQERQGSRVAVPGGFQVEGEVATFAVGEYDAAAPLAIAPVLTYLTLLGGSGADAGTAMAVDAAGAAYLAGFTSSTDLPIASPEQAASEGGNEVFIAKLSPGGNSIVYCTYIGGRGDDRAYGVAVDAAGAAYLAGSTSSTNFPVRAALQATLAGGRNAFVLKLAPAGNALVYSTYLGGTGLDTAYGVALDAAGNAYVAGDTSSRDFPATGLQTVNRGATDGFVAKIAADGSRLLYSTYLGGVSEDHVAAIAVDAAGSAAVAGSTYSYDFPVASAYQPLAAGGQDAFVAKLAADGKSLVFSTYLGGSNGMAGAAEAARAVAVDPAGNVYIAGETSSTNFPVRSAAQSENAGWQDAFAAKFSPSGALIYSTYIGGVNIDIGNGIAADVAGCAYVAGETTSADLASLASGGAATGIYDAFLVKLTPAGDALLGLMYIGGMGADNATAVALDSAGNIYVAGWTQSPNLATVGGVQSTNGGNFSAFLTKLKLGSAVGVAVAPAALALSAGQSQQFSATVTGTASTAVVWSMNPAGAGSITSAGLYTAPATVTAQQTVTITATSVADPTQWASATITLVPATPLRFVPVASCRVADTRGPAGPFGGPALAGGVGRDFNILASGCGVPANAAAFSLTISAAPSQPLGFLSVWPAGQPQPLVSTLNAMDGKMRVNAAVVPAGSAGAVTVYASSATDVVLDVNGYFVPASGLAFYPITPCRIVDTRNATGPLGGPALSANIVRTIPVLSAGCGIPSSAQVYAFNFTVVPYGALASLSAWAAGAAQPGTWVLAAPTGTPLANMSLVAAGTGGSISVSASSTTHLVLDVTGYFAAAATGSLDFYSVPPCRLLDTRNAAGAFGGPGLSGSGSRAFAIPSAGCGIPATAKAFSTNATIVPLAPLGYITLWGSGTMPLVSTMNSLDAQVRANAAFVPAGTNGAVSAFASSPCHLVLDINGYFR